MSDSPRSQRGIMALPAVVAFALSITASWVPSFWHDEAATVSAVVRPLPKLLALLGNVDSVHGAYYLLLHPWAWLFGTSEFSIRLPSAVAIAAAALGVTVIANRLLGLTAGVGAGLVFALLPVASHFGMEARSYAFVCALTTWATYVFIRAVDNDEHDDSWWLWVLYGALILVAGVVFIYSLLIPAAHAVTLLVSGQSRRPVLRFVTSMAAVALALAPLVVIAHGQASQVSYLARTLPTAPWLVPFVWITPRLFDPQNLFTVLVVAIAVLLWSAVAYVVVRWLRGTRAADAPVRSPGSVGLVSLTLPWLLLPAVTLVNASALIQPMYASRYVFYSMPALAILVGFSLSLLHRRAYVATALVALALLVLPILVADRQPEAKDDLRVVASIISDNKQPGDAIIFRPPARRRMEAAYAEGFAGLNDVLLKATPQESDTLTGVQYPLAELPDRLAGVDRVWLLEYKVLGEDGPSRTPATLAEAGFVPEWTWSDSHADVILYVRAS
ncbi:MAG: glycosyltransferase family 39 protein [Candidatus Nanopelagicales bacterium]|nr:glycosyltransferase family 39 protein [Candidatus Nanopelagicales bacterium]